MNKIAKIFICISFAFIFTLSSGLFSSEKASAALVSSASGTISSIPMGTSYNIPLYGNWLFPSTNGSSTDLTLQITSHVGSSTLNEREFMVYLQRAVSGDWITVAHAGYPSGGTKTVTFTREYNNSYLYQTTPYRFLLVNPSAETLLDPKYFTLTNVYYSAY
jgi:hypothetical protein